MRTNENHPLIERPIFVLGLNKSGTSLLYVLLSRHSQLSAIRAMKPAKPDARTTISMERHGIGEGQKFPELPAKLRPPPDGSSGQWATPDEFDRHRLTEADVAEGDRQAVSRAYRAAMVDPARRLCEKSPPNTLRGRYLQALFPDASFIAIVRNPYSTISANGKKRSKWGGVERQTLHWVAGTQTLLDDLERLDRALLVRYEDLIADPAGALHAVCEFCGLTFEPQILSEVAVEQGINDQLIGLLSEEETASITGACSPLMKRLGYEPLHAAPRDSQQERRIAILASMGWGIRNVLMSRALDLLLERADVAVISPYGHVKEFRQRFEGRVRLEDLSEARLDRITKLWETLSMKLFYRLSGSSTHRHKLAAEPKGRVDRVTTLAARTMATPWALRVAKNGLARRFRRMDGYRRWRDYFARERIDTVVSSNPLNLIEYPPLIAARDLGLRTIAIITSWDNPSSKRPLPIEFDEYLVWNDIMAGEVQAFYGVAADRVREIGPLQFDYYFDERLRDSRQEFCAGFGLDPDRKIVVHSTVTGGLFPDEPVFLEKLLWALKHGSVRGNPNLLVRLHPKRDIRDFAHLLVDPAWRGLRVAWTIAGRPVRGMNDRWCPLDDEIRLLTNTVVHGDVNVNMFSTMLVDFAILGKPAVLISHSAKDDRLNYADYLEHIRPVIECGSHRIAYSFQETIEHLNAYLDDPQLDAEGRRRLVAKIGGRYLGKAHPRLVELLLGHDGRLERPVVETFHERAVGQEVGC